MGSFSIWHWIVVLLVFGVPVLVVATTSDQYAVTRKTYVIRALAIFLAGVVLSAAAGGLGDNDLGALGILLAVAMLAAVIYCIRLSAGRCIDAGFSKWWAVLSVVPILGLILFFVLLISGTVKREEAPPASVRPTTVTLAAGAEQGATRRGSGAAETVSTRLQELDKLKAAGVITEEEYGRKRQDILGSL